MTEKPLLITNGFEQFFDAFISKKTALILFLMFCVSLVPGTLAESGFHLNPVSRLIIGSMALNLALCTARRIRSLAKPVLIMHVGTILTLAGGVVSSLGFIATVNIYEGTGVDTAYRWDLEKDAPLGVTLTIKKIDEEYYPVPIKIGVLKGREKAGLFELKTGESFLIGGFIVKADSYEYPFDNMKLTVFQGDRSIGFWETEGVATLPPDFAYDFRLVAHKNPVLKRVSADLMISRGPDLLAEGTTEINSPFEWNGLNFYVTQLENDEYGTRYAGIQIVRDPGKPVVFLGFIIVMTGSLFWLYKKMYGTGKAAKP